MQSWAQLRARVCVGGGGGVCVCVGGGGGAASNAFLQLKLKHYCKNSQASLKTKNGTWLFPPTVYVQYEKTRSHIFI